MLGFKSEYGHTVEGEGISGSLMHSEAFNEAGEFFWGGVKTHEERDALIVQPVEPRWEVVDE